MIGCSPVFTGDKMKIEQWPTKKLVGYKNNPRRNDHAVEKIQYAISRFGFRVPIIAKSDGTVIDGHLRLKAAKRIGLKTVPVVVADDLTDDQILAFRISVNKMADLAEWDINKLAEHFSEMGEIGIDARETGFDQDEIDKIILSELSTVEITEPVRAITYTRVLLSIPTSVCLRDEIDAVAKLVLENGGEVDYAGNNSKEN